MPSGEASTVKSIATRPARDGSADGRPLAWITAMVRPLQPQGAIVAMMYFATRSRPTTGFCAARMKPPPSAFETTSAANRRSSWARSPVCAAAMNAWRRRLCSSWSLLVRVVEGFAQHVRGAFGRREPFEQQEDGELQRFAALGA